MALQTPHYPWALRKIQQQITKGTSSLTSSSLKPPLSARLAPLDNKTKPTPETSSCKKGWQPKEWPPCAHLQTQESTQPPSKPQHPRQPACAPHKAAAHNRHNAGSNNTLPCSATGRPVARPRSTRTDVRPGPTTSKEQAPKRAQPTVPPPLPRQL